jgi:hypothetical protein
MHARVLQRCGASAPPFRVWSRVPRLFAPAAAGKEPKRREGGILRCFATPSTRAGRWAVACFVALSAAERTRFKRRSPSAVSCSHARPACGRHNCSGLTEKSTKEMRTNQGRRRGQTERRGKAARRTDRETNQTLLHLISLRAPSQTIVCSLVCRSFFSQPITAPLHSALFPPAPLRGLLHGRNMSAAAADTDSSPPQPTRVRQSEDNAQRAK